MSESREGTPGTDTCAPERPTDVCRSDPRIGSEAQFAREHDAVNEWVHFDGAEVGAVEPRVAVDIEPASIEVHCPVVIQRDIHAHLGRETDTTG